MSALGAATSDALESGQVVSGVGGQYNFVAMAHALRDARSVLMLRATREAQGRALSNIVWSHGHVTIPRHLRDLVITEYGIADLRDACDEDCVLALLRVTDAAFAPELRARALRNGKIAAAHAAGDAWSSNDAAALVRTLAPFRRDGVLPDYPLGCDFTSVEQRLVRALGWLRRATASRGGLLRTIGAALAQRGSPDLEALQRMDLARPTRLRDRLAARLVSLALARTAA
jgi:hypothetical protein